jgi:hypothetical protein
MLICTGQVFGFTICAHPAQELEHAPMQHEANGIFRVCVWAASMVKRRP